MADETGAVGGGSLWGAVFDFLKTKPTVEIVLILMLASVVYGAFFALPEYANKMEASHRSERAEWRTTIDRMIDCAKVGERPVANK